MDIDAHLTAEKLDHIFKEYLYFVSKESFGNDGQTTFNYELRTDKFDSLFSDTVLGTVMTYWLSIHYLQDILNSSKIRLVTNVNHPDYVYLYFDQEISDISYAMISEFEKSTEFITDHMYAISVINHYQHTIIDEDEDYLISHIKNKHENDLNNQIVIINENFITDNDKQQAVDNLFTSFYKDNSEIIIPVVATNIKGATRFAFKITIYETEYVILLSTNYNNYIIGNRLKEAFKQIDTKVNHAIQEQKEISYLYNTVAMTGNITDEQYFIENYKPVIYDNSFINITNSYLEDWVNTKYCTGSLEFDVYLTHENAIDEIKTNIFQYIDDIGKGIAYFDFDDSLVHATIGAIDDYNYLGIYGYDEARQRPIILGINKDYESAGTWFRPIKIVSGGISAINNDELKNDITSSEYEYLLNTTLVDVNDIHFMDVIGMVNSVYGLPVKYPKEITLFNPLDSDRKFFYNDNEFDARAETISGQAYKQTLKESTDATSEYQITTFENMKTFVLDFGKAFYNYYEYRIGSIEFQLDSTNVTPDLVNITEIETNLAEPNGFSTACSTSAIKTSAALPLGYNIKRYDAGTAYGEFRRILEFDTPITFNKIIFSNYVGTSVYTQKFGMGNGNVYMSTEAATAIVDAYNDPTNLTHIAEIQAEPRTTLDDPQETEHVKEIQPTNLPTYIMKSMIIDIDSNWGSTSSTGFGQIALFKDGYEVTPNYTTLILSSANKFTDEPSKDPVTSIYLEYLFWQGTYASPTAPGRNIINEVGKIRCVVVFDEDVEFDECLVSNYYNNGTTDRGIKDVNIYVADFEFENYEHGYGTNNLVTLFSGQIPEHLNWNIRHTQRLWLESSDSVRTHTNVEFVTILDTGSFGRDTTEALSYAIPYDAMLDLFDNVSNVTEMNAFLSRWFWVDGDSNSVTFDNIEYNNLFLKYVPILSGHSMHKVSHQNSVVGFRIINEQLLRTLTFDLKHDILKELQSNTGDITEYKLLCGTDIVEAINDDSEFDVNSDQPSGIFKDGINVEETHSLANSPQSEFLTMLLHENIYHSDITVPSGKYICGLFKLRDVAVNSFNSSIIFNKVIGSDWYSYYSLKSGGNDISFSGYFISSYTDNHYAWWLLDLDNGKIKSLTSSPFEFNCGVANPIITNMEVISNRELYVIDKSEYDQIYNNWLNVFKIYDILPQYEIVYARKPFDIDRNQIFNVYANEWTIVKEV